MQSTHSTFKSFKAFYPYYLKEHRNVTCRRLHFIGSTLVIVVIAITLLGRVDLCGLKFVQSRGD